MWLIGCGGGSGVFLLLFLGFFCGGVVRGLVCLWFCLAWFVCFEISLSGVVLRKRQGLE